MGKKVVSQEEASINLLGAIIRIAKDEVTKSSKQLYSTPASKKDAIDFLFTSGKLESFLDDYHLDTDAASTIRRMIKENKWPAKIILKLIRK